MSLQCSDCPNGNLALSKGEVELTVIGGGTDGARSCAVFYFYGSNTEETAEIILE
jgi:hypothetical protein